MAEEHRSGRRELDQRGDHQHRDRDQQQDERADHDVLQALEPPIDATGRCVTDADEREIADRTPASTEELVGEEVRNQVDADGGIGELAHDLRDALLGPER